MSHVRVALLHKPTNYASYPMSGERSVFSINCSKMNVILSDISACSKFLVTSCIFSLNISREYQDLSPGLLVSWSQPFSLNVSRGRMALASVGSHSVALLGHRIV